MRSERLKMTNSVEMVKIQDRVQKLLNMAKDASSPNEAMIAMERARRLMDKYQIEETDLETVDETRWGAAMMFGKQYKFMPVWMNIMATALCKLNGVVGGVIYGDIGIMGLEEDVMLTKMMFDRLAQECINQCKIDQEARGFGARYNAKVGDAFKKGFVTAVAQKINQIMASQQAETTALIVRKHDIVEAKFGKMKTVDKATKTRADEDARSAYAMGAVRGNQAKIRSEIN